MPLRAVLFDLDGTLIDSTADIAWSANTLLARHQFPVHPVESFTRFIGDGVRMLVTRILPAEARSPGRITQLIEEYRGLYAEHWNVETCVYPGIPELLEILQRRGMKMAVLSNKPHDFTVQCVQHYLKPGTFEIVMGAGNDFPGKPDPAAALHIAGRMGIAAEAFAYLGDTDTDMRTANRAGMHAVGVLWGLRRRAELIEHGAKTLIGKPDELLPLVEI